MCSAGTRTLVYAVVKVLLLKAAAMQVSESARNSGVYVFSWYTSHDRHHKRRNIFRGSVYGLYETVPYCNTVISTIIILYSFFVIINLIVVACRCLFLDVLATFMLMT